MEKENDILKNPRLKQNPYSTPQGYFESMEDAVHKRIAGNNTKPMQSFIGAIKPAFALCCSFLLIFAIGYLTMQLTKTSKSDIVAQSAEIDSAIFVLDELNLQQSAINYYLDNEDYINQQDSLSAEEICTYLEEEPFNTLAYLYE